MRMPWKDRTGLAKAVAVLVTVLLVSTGLCGLNVITEITIFPFDSGPSKGIRALVANALLITAYIESVLMGLCIVGLILVALIAIARTIKNHFTPS